MKLRILAAAFGLIGQCKSKSDLQPVRAYALNDLNGDGKNDICIERKNGTSVWLYSCEMYENGPTVYVPKKVSWEMGGRQ